MEDILYEKNYLIKEKYEIKSRLKIIEKRLDEIQEHIINNCVHEWKTEREDCMYGETFTICKKCGVFRTF